ncbi:hypothetical protein KIN20_027466 [Parelaphostrongylus tenuis]|uniref:Uncharacterized protein n=1 Tax=Parelaphostrongylus tenuis TaxID=148309 RepID=A0AAD5QZF1_PARTN|nr:hypothetical protein KIN20_027466 [Parelaphostrongylus tenuis]
MLPCLGDHRNPIIGCGQRIGQINQTQSNADVKIGKVVRIALSVSGIGRNSHVRERHLSC